MPELPSVRPSLARKRHIDKARQTPPYVAHPMGKTTTQAKRPGIFEMQESSKMSFETLAEPTSASALSSMHKNLCAGNTCISSSSTAQHVPDAKQARCLAPSQSPSNLMDMLMSRPDRTNNFSVYSASRLSSNATCLDQTCTPNPASQLTLSQSASPILQSTVEKPSSPRHSSPPTHFAVAAGQATRLCFSDSQRVDALDLATPPALATEARSAPSQPHDSFVASKKKASSRLHGGAIESFKRIVGGVHSLQSGDDDFLAVITLDLPCDTEDDETPRHQVDDKADEDVICDNAVFLTLADFGSLEHLDLIVGKMPPLRRSRTPFTMFPFYCYSCINSKLMSCFTRVETTRSQPVPEQYAHEGAPPKTNANDAVATNGRADRQRKIRILRGRRTRAGRRITI